MTRAVGVASVVITLPYLNVAGDHMLPHFMPNVPGSVASQKTVILSG